MAGRIKTEQLFLFLVSCSMMLQRFFLIFIVCEVARISALPQENQSALDEIISRLSYNNTSGVGGTGGVLMLPPTFSVDIWSLLKAAVQQEIEKQTAEIVSLHNIKQAKSVSSSLSYYPKSNLDLVNLGGKNYFFSKHQKMSWIDAVSFCRLHNMDLVSVETREEDTLIINHLKTLGLAGKVVVYTSGNKIGTSTYQWLNGEKLMYHNWLAGQPAQYATEHCLVYWEGAWHDYHCIQHEFHFICEET